MKNNLGNINETSKNNIKETKSSEKINNSNNIKKKIWFRIQYLHQI